MEQIFANPGFKHIADQIISCLDLKSMINFKQVNQTIGSHFKSIKTCQLFFEKFMMKISSDELGQYKFFNAVPERFILEKSKTSLSKFNPFEKCWTFMFHQGGFGSDQIDQSWMQELNEKEKLQCNKIWKMYTFIELAASNLWNIYSEDLKLNETLKILVTDAFKSLNDCPLILAVETRQEQLVQKMLKYGFFNICHCTNLNSIFQFARTYQWYLAKYILMRESFLPIDQVSFKKTLEIAQRKRKCHETDEFILVSRSKAIKIDKIKYGRTSPK